MKHFSCTLLISSNNLGNYIDNDEWRIYPGHLRMPWARNNSFQLSSRYVAETGSETGIRGPELLKQENFIPFAAWKGHEKVVNLLLTQKDIRRGEQVKIQRLYSLASCKSQSRCGIGSVRTPEVVWSLCLLVACWAKEMSKRSNKYSGDHCPT